MKILQICPYDFSRPGGVKTHILGLSKALRDEGHSVKIVVPNQSGLEGEQTEIRAFGRNHGFAFGGTKIDLNICLGSEWRRLRKFMREEKFDVAHYHTIWNPVLALQVRMIFRGHQVATFHDTPSNTRVGRFLGRWIMPLMGKAIFHWLDEMISVSETQKRGISRFSKRKVHVISNGIAPFEKGESIEKYSDNKFNVLFLGRMEPRKGVMDAIKAFEIFKKQIAESRLIVAGDGRERGLAERYCLQKKLMDVEFLGQVEEIGKQDLLASADLFVASARYGESFGIILLEAMQAGVPLVGYANEGYRELLNPEQLAYFANPEDIVGLADSMSRIQKLKTCLELRKLGIDYAATFEWPKIVKQIERLYSIPEQ